MGKSAILSAWLTRHIGAKGIVPHHFIRRAVADWDLPEVIVTSLTMQAEQAFPALRDPHAKPERRLLELLGRISRQLRGQESFVVVIDALDEARAASDDNPLPRFLPHRLPPGVRILCSTRPTHPHIGWMAARSSVRCLDLDDRDWSGSNKGLIRAFWQEAARTFDPPLSPDAIAVAISRADGNVLHATMLNESLRHLPTPARCVDRMPRGLEALIDEIWERAALRPGVRAALGLLSAAQEALSLDVISELADWSYEDRKHFVQDARQLLIEEPGSWSGQKGYRLRHDWLREIVHERLGSAVVRSHHGRLSRILGTWPPPVDGTRRTYAVRHALAHRIATSDWARVRDLAFDLEYLEARVHVTDVSAVEQELTHAGAACPQPAAARELHDLARALAQESHWIRSDPDGAAGLVWNRLARIGWSKEALETRIGVPWTSRFLRLRHALSRDSGGLERTLDGHAGGVTACAVTPDGRRIVSGSSDRTLKLWDLESGHLRATFVGHADAITACAALPDGDRMVSASGDGTLKVWTLDTGQVLSTLNTHTAAVTACIVSSRDSRVVSASADRTLMVWTLDPSR